MAIISENPPTIPPVEPKVYPIWWIQKMSIEAPECNAWSPAKLVVEFRAMRRDTNGNGEFFPGEDNPRTLVIDNIFDVQNQPAELGPVIDMVVDALGQLAKMKRIIN